MLLFMENGTLKGEVNLEIERNKQVAHLQADKLLFRKYTYTNKIIDRKHIYFMYDGSFHFSEVKIKNPTDSIKLKFSTSFLKCLLVEVKVYLMRNHIAFNNIKLINN